MNSRTLKSFFVPGGIWFFGCMLLVNSGWLTLALPALGFLFYCAVGGGMLLAWRFHSSRILFSLLVFFLAQQAANLSVAQPPFIPATLHALAVLVPVNIILIALMRERGFARESVAPVILFLAVESLTLTVFCGAAVRVPHLSNPVDLPRYALLVSAFAAIFLVVRFLLNRKPVDIALLWSLAAFLLALRSAPVARTSTAFWIASACILATAVIESSYLLAYHDELTNLPSRRAFNEATQRLKLPYSIAVVDIDHFKKFNDTYGHDIGDEVLRLVAANLGRVSGGGQAYRCGGEEFNILFGGKTSAEVLPHLERLREAIEKAEFRLRGDDRRQAPRGPDRRNSRKRAGSAKGGSIRQPVQRTAVSLLSVTVSIGVATATREEFSPHAVLESADKALYRAKADGRNRVEAASSSGRRISAKTAGIA